jgi:hypothetical protein
MQMTTVSHTATLPGRYESSVLVDIHRDFVTAIITLLRVSA